VVVHLARRYLVPGFAVAADRYIYQVSFDAFFLRAMGPRLDAGARERLREVGLSVDGPGLPVYPADLFLRGVAVAAEAAYPALPRGEAHFRAGCDHVDAFAAMQRGRLMAAFARQIEPHVILEYTGTFIRLGNNFTEARARKISPTRAELWLNDVGEVPEFYRGIVHRGLETAAVKGVSVAVTEATVAPSATYDVRWVGR
jgi:uncharacterized protein (TIGR02265 family)